MAMSIMPAAVLTGLSIAVNLGAALVNLLHSQEWSVLGISLLQMLLNLYLTLFVIGGITTATEWRNIHCRAWKKLAIPVHLPAVHVELCSHCDPVLFRHTGMDADPAYAGSERTEDLR